MVGGLAGWGACRTGASLAAVGGLGLGTAVRVGGSCGMGMFEAIEQHGDGCGCVEWVWCAGVGAWHGGVSSWRFEREGGRGGDDAARSLHAGISANGMHAGTLDTELLRYGTLLQIC